MRVETTFEDGVAVITINQPERKNAITLGMRTEIEHAFLKAQDDNDVCAIVLTGAGSNFSAGADLSEGGGDGVRGSLYRMRLLHRMARGVAGTNKPVVAAVQGVCIGMSWALALACDMVVCAENARFQFAFRHIGLYSGRFVSGSEARDLGLALYALPTAEVLPKALDLARSFVNAPTLALSMAKRMFDAAPGHTYDQALDFEASIQPLMIQTQDVREGATSFKEKRQAAFTGN
jgi:2-(1,2-epoxy-1,2-dihydrophenyl)acetyl-CoA isomerase